MQNKPLLGHKSLRLGIIALYLSLGCQQKLTLNSLIPYAQSSSSSSGGAPAPFPSPTPIPTPRQTSTPTPTLSPSVNASRVFIDGFESGTTNLWLQDGTRDLCVVASQAHDGGLPHSGSGMAECNWNGVVNWQDPASIATLHLDGWKYTSETFLRFWFRYDKDVDIKNGSKQFRFGTGGGFGSGNISDGGTGLFFYYFNADGSAVAPAYWGSQGASVVDGQWHKLEIYVKKSSSAGVIRTWYDSAQIWDSGNADTSRQDWNDFYMMSNWSTNDVATEGHDANNHVYWDDFEVYSDSTTGAAVTGRMNDASIHSIQ